MFNVRATYQREAAKAIEHLASIGVTRVAVLETDDSFGADSATGALKGFAKVGLTPVLQEKFPRDKPDFTALASQVFQTNAQAMMVIGSASNIANAVQAVRAAGSRAQVITLSNNASGGFIKQMGDNARGVIVTQVFPNERSVAFPLIKQAQDLAKAKGLASAKPAKRRASSMAVLQALTMSTGSSAWASTFCATLPRISDLRPRRPCEPITIKSQPSALAVSRTPS